MKAISIRQPWAWLIVNAGKDIEDRSWATKFRGRLLIHASNGMTRYEYDQAVDQAFRSMVMAGDLGGALRLQVPSFESIERGGIVGSVEIVDCVTTSSSSWFTGQKGFVLANPEQLPFTPLRGSLGIFEVPDELVPPSTCQTCGCSWTRACPGGCYWVAPGLCSACAEIAA